MCGCPSAPGTGPCPNPICVQVPFDYPSTSPVQGTLP
jgi:hypothetical protein